MDHLYELVFDMRSLCRAVVISGKGGSADEDVTYANLAAPVALAVVSCEPLDKEAAVIILSAHEDVFPRNEHVLEHHQGLVPAELSVAHIYVAAFEFPRIAGLPAVDVIDALCVSRRDEAHGIVRVVLLHGDCGHHENPVRVYRSV